jgi:hypothetical protein
MRFGLVEVENCLLVAGPNVAAYAMMDDIRDRGKPGTDPVGYFGSRNQFWPANLASRWVEDRNRRGVEAERQEKVDEWLRGDRYRETEPLFRDPELASPAGGDYRPRGAVDPEIPRVRIDPKTWRAAQDFYRWSGFSPDRWGPLPPE